MKKRYKTTFVILGAVVLSTVAIQASDVLRNVEGNLAGLVIENGSPCGAGALMVNLGTGPLCVDIYEASPSQKCPVGEPASQTQTQENMNDFNCQSVSTDGAMPWRYVSLAQAQQVCGRSGKRLPTNDEWYALAVSVADQSGCVISGQAPQKTGTSQCLNQAGISDLVGNVWEWIDAEVYDGQYKQRPLPESGYVHVVDSDGVVIETAGAGSQEYGNDYATVNTSGVRGIIRGGFYGSGDDAGIYAQNIAVPLDFKAPGVGFRCVKSI